MMPISQFAVRLAGQFAASWGNHSIASTEVVAIHADVPLPRPWDRLTLRTLRSLEDQLQARPQLVYAVSAVLGLDEGVVRNGMGDRYEPSEFQRVTEDCRTYVRETPDHIQFPSVLRKIESRLDEKEALKIFRELSIPALHYVLWELHRDGKLHDLINDFESGILCWTNKRALVNLLTKERLPELTIPVRAALVYAMQKGVTGSVMEEGIANIFTGTGGENLTRLKGIVDGRSPQDMVELVDHDVDSGRLRKRIIAHIQRQAAEVRPDIRLIVSDIDDTVIRNWKDERYPSKAVYPGVRAFYRAVGRLDANDWERRGPVFDSARPGEPTGAVESWTAETLRGIGFHSPTILSGDLLHLIGASIATGKFNNYVRYDRLFPEFCKILIGDNGQYDVDFERQVLTAYAETAIAGFIHDIGEISVERPNAYDWEELTPPAGPRRIFYFDTYIGAALAAFEMGTPLISLDDLHRVAREALAEFEDIKFDSKDRVQTVWNLLRRDYDVVERKHGKIDSI